MTRTKLGLLLGLGALGAACGSSSTTTGTSSTTSSTTGTSATSTGTGGSGGAGGSSSTSTGGGSTTSSTTGTGGSGGTGGGMSGPPTADQLLALLGSCTPVSTGFYKTDNDPNAPADISICGLQGAVFWKADLDVDCDGGKEPACKDDASYLPDTSATDTQGNPLDASTLPYVVVPLPSSRFDYNAAGLSLGSVIAVIYKGQVRYGIFGDEGPKTIIGEASYAMAQSLGIDPDPNFGGVDSGVTYIAFTGAGAVVTQNENHDEAVAIGEELAAGLISAN
jgi:hypothetical protein